MKIFCDRLPRLAAKHFRVGTGVLVALGAVLLAGCGGGGGGGGSSTGGSTTPTGSQTFSGTVTNTTGGASSEGYTVRFNNTTFEAVTSSTGAFSISVPEKDITGSDTIFVLDQSNTVQATSATLTNDTSGLQNIAISIGPPPPGSVPLFRKQ